MLFLEELKNCCFIYVFGCNIEVFNEKIVEIIKEVVC